MQEFALENRPSLFGVWVESATRMVRMSNRLKQCVAPFCPLSNLGKSSRNEQAPRSTLANLHAESCAWAYDTMLGRWGHSWDRNGWLAPWAAMPTVHDGSWACYTACTVVLQRIVARAVHENLKNRVQAQALLYYYFTMSPSTFIWAHMDHAHIPFGASHWPIRPRCLRMLVD